MSGVADVGAAYLTGALVLDGVRPLACGAAHLLTA
jgi:hypothetical protein